jgi:hypothetical protein
VVEGSEAAAIGDDTPLALGRRADLRQLALVLVEAVFSSLARGGPSAATGPEAFQRLLVGIFAFDITEFEAYCRAEPDWNAAVAVLDEDEKAGWALLRGMVEGKWTAAELTEAAFCRL